MFDRNKRWFAYTPWQTFAVFEGVVRMLNLAVLRTIAMYVLAPVASFAAVGLIGLVRFVGGLVLTIRSGFSLYPNTKAVLGSMLTGLLVAYTTFVPIYLFIVSDVSLLVFALLLAVGFIPGILMSTWKATGKVTFLQIVGTLLLVALGALLVKQSVTANSFFVEGVLLLSLPVAAFIKELIVGTLGTARTISAWVHNVWAGLSMVIFSTIALLMFNSSVLFEGALIASVSILVVLSVVSGVLYLATVFLRQKSFHDMGGVFAKKKNLITVATCGVALVLDLILFQTVPLYLVGTLIVVLIGSFLITKR